MKTKLTKIDKNCLGVVIDIATKTYEQGNYPVGALLTIGGKVVDQAGNQIHKRQSYTAHAENTVILRNGKKIFKAWKNKEEIFLYSTLEPCIQCLGACVTNHVNRIVYIQKDPNGGACNMKHDNIGDWYANTWPEIVHAPISDEPLKRMIDFFHDEIARGNVSWPEKMLKLFGESKR